MVHKIHMGKELPSVEAGKPCQIVGFQQRVFDFSTVGFPNQIRNCEVWHRSRSPAWPATAADPRRPTRR